MKATTIRRKKAASASAAAPRQATPVVAVSAPRRRQRLNLSVRADYVEQARAAKLNLSRVLEEGLAVRLKIERERVWLEENREAIAAYNAYIEKHGLWHRGLTDWY